MAPDSDPSQRRIPRSLKFPEAPWPEREPPEQANKSSTEPDRVEQPDQVEQRRVVYNKDGHEPSVQKYMSNPSDRIPSPLPLRYSLASSRGWARKLMPPNEPPATKDAPAREEAVPSEEAAPPEESPSMDPLMLFYNQMVPAKGSGGSAAVGSESRPETGGIATGAKRGGTGVLARKEQQLNEKERRLEDLERKLNALAIKLEEKSEGKGKEQGELRVGETRDGERRFSETRDSDRRFGERHFGETRFSEARDGESRFGETRDSDRRFGETHVGERRPFQKDQPHWAAVKKAIHPFSPQARLMSPD